MSRYLVRRIGWVALVLWGVSVISFIILHLTPGDPAQILLGPLATAQELNRLRQDLGLDRPSDDLIVRLAYWTQSYRRTKNESTDRMALFLCSNKDSFFMHPVNSRNRFCQNCRA